VLSHKKEGGYNSNIIILYNAYVPLYQKFINQSCLWNVAFHEELQYGLILLDIYAN